MKQKGKEKNANQTNCTLTSALLG